MAVPVLVSLFIAAGAFAYLGSGRNAGKTNSNSEPAVSAKDIAQALAFMSGKPRKVFTYHVNLDRAASAAAGAVIRDEYETWNCSSSSRLFVPPVAIGRGVSVIPNQCSDYAKDHFWFVAGTLHIVKNCDNEDALGPGYIVKTNECFRFKVVGAKRGLVGKGLLSYPWNVMQMQLVRRHGRWLVASEDEAYLDNANGYQLWLRRVR